MPSKKPLKARKLTVELRFNGYAVLVNETRLHLTRLFNTDQKFDAKDYAAQYAEINRCRAEAVLVTIVVDP